MRIYQTPDDYTTHEDELFDQEEDSDGVDYLIYDDGYIEQEPRWNRRRSILFMVALIIIGVMLIVLIAPFLQTIISPVPAYIPPLATPASQL